MKQDIRRARTFLSSKGLQWEPILGENETADQARFFKASHEGNVCFKGAILSIGKEINRGDGPVTIIEDQSTKDGLRLQLARQLGKAVRNLDAEPDKGLPQVVIFANHDPMLEFEDLTYVIDTSSESGLLKIQLFIWFDDLKSDKLLMSRADTKLYRILGFDEEEP